MRDYLDFYIGGEWVKPVEPRTLDVVNPADESVAGRISIGGSEDVDRAVAAARAAFPSCSETTREQRLELLQAIAAEYQKRYSEIADAITEEMGAPSALAQRAQAAVGIGHLQTAIAVLKDYEFEAQRGNTLIKKEPIGVCGFITPWNWPINQIATKVFPALATGCTMVLKPSEIAPFSGYIFAEVLDCRRRSGRSLQPRQRRRSDRRRRHRRPSRRRHGLLHRLDPGRDRGRQGRRGHGQAGPSGAGRQVALPGAGRCRRRQGGDRRHAPHADQLRPVVQRADPPPRPQSSDGGGQGSGEGGRREDPGRRPEGRRPARPGRLRRPVEQDPGPDRERRGGRGDPARAAARASRTDSTRAITSARPSSPTSTTT